MEVIFSSRFLLSLSDLSLLTSLLSAFFKTATSMEPAPLRHTATWNPHYIHFTYGQENSYHGQNVDISQKQARPTSPSLLPPPFSLSALLSMLCFMCRKPLLSMQYCIQCMWSVSSLQNIQSSSIKEGLKITGMFPAPWCLLSSAFFSTPFFFPPQ